MSKYKWTQIRAEGSPVERSSHGVSVVGSQLIVYGGEHVARTPIDSSVHALDLSTSTASDDKKRWVILKPKSEENIPAPRVAHAQCAVGSKVYVFGGRQGVHMDEAPLNDFYAFDTDSLTWENLSSECSPSPRSFHRMVGVGDCAIYVFGGCGAEGRLADLHCYSLKSQTWTQLPSCDLISGRGGPGFTVSADNQSLFVIGGFSGKEMNDVFRYDIQAQTWKEIYAPKNSPVRPFSVSAGAVVSGRIIFFGGEVEASNKGHEGAGGFAQDCQAFDGVDGSLSPIQIVSDQFPTARGWAAADVLGTDRLVVFGGLTGDDENPVRLNDVWVLEPY
uniref:Uncharacterized protein n=1 Tax=Aplanochytrium stocchinoi TaxID=215587 RepID=A0A7S3PKB3_9STRA